MQKRVRLQLAARGENVLFWPQNLDIWGQKSIFCLVIAIFVDGANDHYTRGYNFPIGTTPKKFSVSELGVIFWGSPLFLAVFGHSHVRRATTLNFGPISTKLGGIVRAIKKMTQKDNGPGPGRNYGETAVFTFGQKVFFLAKNGFWSKKSLKISEETDIYLEKGNFFLWTKFSGRGQKMVNPKEWTPFFGPKISDFGPKIRFLPYDPNFGQWPIFSPRHDG